jgi:adenine-specific DNA-methyltransferase
MPTPASIGQSPDVLAQRRQELLNALSHTHPELIKDHQLDVSKLQELLTPEHLADRDEHYELMWAGKAAARREVQKTTSHTLRPSADNPAHAPHMLIEGENLDVLRVLQRSYHGKVKMIYIDPPYNTGNDSFVYPDDYSETLDEYQKRTGEKNEAGYLNKQSLWKKNSKESGHYHSAWLSMMYPRLYLARNLLRDDGVIFISIDDNEAANLKLLCDEVFGADNFLANIVWEKVHTRKNSTRFFSTSHEHLLAFAKNKDKWDRLLLPREHESAYKNPDNHPKGPWKLDPITAHNEYSANYTIQKPNGVVLFRPKGRYWRFSEQTIKTKIAAGEIVWGDGESYPMVKRFLSEVQDGLVPTTLFDRNFAGDTTYSKKEIESVLEIQAAFDYAKPTLLIKRCLQISCRTQDLILDFFAGSGTTAHAVMALNAEDGGNRRCISVQLPEVLDENSEAYKAGYRTVADITRARIDKVIAKLKAEHPNTTKDLACAHFTLAPSNFKVWRSDVNDVDALREQLALFKQAETTSVANKAQAQTAMLAELLLKHGLGALGVDALNQPLPVGEATVHRVSLPDARAMWLCFDTYTPALKEAIVAHKPAHMVLLNSCFLGDKADELLSNLRLELAALDINLTVI